MSSYPENKFTSSSISTKPANQSEYLAYPGAPPPYAPTQPTYPNKPIQTVIITGPNPLPQLLVIGSMCPICNSGRIREEFSVLGIALAILFFPIGILCCLTTRQTRCSNCRAHVPV